MRYIPLNQQDRELRRKYTNKRHDSKIREIQFNLSYDQYKQLIEEAGILYTDIGFGASKYCLGRYVDTGGYSIGNCRFITNTDNAIEGSKTKRVNDKRLGGGSYPSCKGNKHYKSKGYVITPWGKFETIREAAKHKDAKYSASFLGKLLANPDKIEYYYK